MTSLGWSELVSTALVGMSRRPAASWSTALSSLVPPAALETPITEASLLGAVGAITLARRAGVRAVLGVSRPAPAPDDDRPIVGAAAASRLDSLLGSNDLAGLELWLTLAADRGRRVPGRFLAGLLHAGRLSTSLRPLIVTVAGERGRWLASQRAEWRMFAEPVAADAVLEESVWSEGTQAERVAYLASLRRADPAKARELLEDAWSQEAPADRAAMLATFADGLGLADEAFCEAALADRRKEVREVAATLLGVLPGSAYRERMAARARACVTRQGRRVVVGPPVECDAAMKRDGIEPKPPAGIGARAWWLDQVVSAAPLDTWSILDANPADLIARKVADEWAATLHRAWGRAAVRSRDAEWATVLLKSGFGRGKNVDILNAAVAADLHTLLPGDTAAVWALEELRRKDPNPTDLSRLLDACPRPWSQKLATALLTYLRDQALTARTSYVSPRLRELSRVITAGLPLDAAADVIALADKLRATHDDPAVTSVMDAVVETVSVRYQMLMEFA